MPLNSAITLGVLLRALVGDAVAKARRTACLRRDQRRWVERRDRRRLTPEGWAEESDRRTRAVR